MTLSEYISLVPLASVCVALVAVFVGPTLSYFIARRQWDVILATSRTQVLAPIRSKWISELRDLIAQARSRAHYYYVAESDGEADWKGARKDFHQEMTKLHHQIDLMLDPAEPEEKELMELVAHITVGITNEYTNKRFPEIMNRMETLARSILRSRLNSVAFEVDEKRA